MDVYPQKLQQGSPDIHGMFPGIVQEPGNIGPGLAEVAAVADRQIGTLPDAVLAVRVKDEYRVILLSSSVHGIRQADKGAHLVVAYDILSVRSKGDQLFNENIHFFVRLVALHDPVAGAGRHFF